RGAPGNVAATAAGGVPPAAATPGPIVFSIDVAASTPRTGVLAVGWSAFAHPTASITASVDVGADGSVEWAAAAGGSLWTLPLILGATPLPVIVTIDARAFGTGDAQTFVDAVGDLTIACLADPPSTCTAAPFGASCAPSLA